MQLKIFFLVIQVDNLVKVLLILCTLVEWIFDRISSRFYRNVIITFRCTNKTIQKRCVRFTRTLADLKCHNLFKQGRDSLKNELRKSNNSTNRWKNWKINIEKCPIDKQEACSKNNWSISFNHFEYSWDIKRMH